MTVAGKGHRLRLSGAASLLLVLAACGTGSNSGSSGGGGNGQVKTGPGINASTKTINVGILSPLSGPVAVIGKPLTQGQEAWFKHVNDNGGIDGWKINYIEKDSLYNPQTHVQLYNDIVGNVAMIAQSLGSPTTKAIQQQADTEGIVVGAAAQDSEFVVDKVMAVIGTPYAADVANGVDYIVNTLGKKDAKIGIIYQNDAYGQDGLKGYQAALDAYHFNDVDRETYNATDKDFTAQVLHLKQKGAEYVFVTAIPSAAGTIVGTAAVAQYLPHWVFQGPAWSEYLMTKDGTSAGAHTPIFPALAATTWVLGYEAGWGDTSVPGMAQFLADHDKYFPQQPPDGYYMYGYCEAQVETAILKKAIENGDLSRQGILNAKLNLGTFDFGGLIPPLKYTPSLGPADRKTDIAAVDPTSPGFLKVIHGFSESTAADNLTFGSS